MKRSWTCSMIVAGVFCFYGAHAMAFFPDYAPTEIGSIDELQMIGLDPAYPLNGYYILTGDIDASVTENWDNGAGFLPIGAGFDEEKESQVCFKGWFDGRGHVIRNLYINRPEDNGIGLFRTLGFSSVVVNVRLEGGSTTGAHYVGTLAGGSWSPNLFACSAEVSASGISRVGGLLGLNRGVMDSCYATGLVTGEFFIGGLAGRNYRGDMVDCYAAGPVSGLSRVGGLVGNTMDGVVEASFWDVTTSGVTVSAGGMGYTTQEMMQGAIYTAAGWDLSGLWTLAPGRGYPYLR